MSEQYLQELKQHVGHMKKNKAGEIISEGIMDDARKSIANKGVAKRSGEKVIVDKGEIDHHLKRNAAVGRRQGVLMSVAAVALYKGIKSLYKSLTKTSDPAKKAEIKKKIDVKQAQLKKEKAKSKG